MRGPPTRTTLAWAAVVARPADDVRLRARPTRDVSQARKREAQPRPPTGNAAGVDVGTTWFSIVFSHEQVRTTTSDGGLGIDRDRLENVECPGQTSGTFPAQDSAGKSAFFLAKHTPRGERTIPQFGTSGADLADGFAVDAQGNVDLAGSTSAVMAGFGILGASGVLEGGRGRRPCCGAALNGPRVSVSTLRTC